MNTKTMRLPPRRVLTPSTTTTGTTTNKRKEREESFDRPKPKPKPITTTTSKLLKPDKPISRPISEPILTTPTPSSTSSTKGFELPPSNQLLAGYLAHEYLTKGTLFGQPWVPARAESPTVEEKKEKAGDDSCGGEGDGGEGAGAAAPCRRAEEEERERYAKVTGLLRNGGVHLQGVVNPTQLARFLHL